MYSITPLVLRSRSDRVIVQVSGTSSMSTDAGYMCLDLFVLSSAVRLLVGSNVVNVCVSVRCEIIVFLMCILFCDV